MKSRCCILHFGGGGGGGRSGKLQALMQKSEQPRYVVTEDVMSAKPVKTRHVCSGVKSQRIVAA